MNRRAILAVLGLAIALSAGMLGWSLRSAGSGVDPASGKAWTVPDVDTLPDSPVGRSVRQGRELVIHTARLIGPQAADPARRFAGNNLNCQSCHIAAGTKQFGLPLVGAYADFPNYRAREGRIGTIEERVNGCMARSMNGRALPSDSPEMTAIVAYLRFLSSGTARGAKTFGRGAGKMDELTRAADPVRGSRVFTQSCAGCHGLDGQGLRAQAGDQAPGYVYPPLWGPDSFNSGAGMARLITAANFIRANMPHGTTWKAPMLSLEDAWDVAAFINSQSRPQMQGLEADYPVRSEKPLDAPFGPYADSFSAQQHKYGPFAPMRAGKGEKR